MFQQQTAAVCAAYAAAAANYQSRSHTVSNDEMTGIQALERASFTSTDELRQRILAFIDSFNATAKPFKWTYAGRPLKV